MNVLFVCSRNKLRSPTAEQIFCDQPGFEVQSAGTDQAASVPLSVDLIQWAAVIFVMEKTHRKKVQEKYRAHLKNTRVRCLEIPDEFDYMDPDLIDLLHRKLNPFFTTR